MSVYLHDIPLPEALAALESSLENAGLGGILGEETLPLNESTLDRILSQPVFARLSSPHYHASAMDGFAIQAHAISRAQPSNPISLLHGSQTQYIDTGDPLPDWADSVVPIELTEPLDASGQPAGNPRQPYQVRFRTALPPWSHIRAMGEDMVASQLVLPPHHRLRPVDLGALAASGAVQVTVSRKPKVAILPTGTELVPIGQPVSSGDIIEFNSVVMAAQLQQWGAQPQRYPITKDDFDQLCLVVQQCAAESDLILINAGSSAGSEDFTAAVITRLGQVLVHGIAVRPGHPVVIGMVRRSPSSEQMIPVIGVPGYPVSAALTMEIIVEPLISRWLGRIDQPAPEVQASLTRKITSPAGDDDYVRVVLGQVGEKLLAAPLPRGAGAISSLSRADGITIIRRGIQGLESDSNVSVRLYQPVSALKQTIFSIGSHDMSLDILAQFLSQKSRRLVSANVGSQGGLIAIRRGETHLAGCHLLDMDTGEYNVAAIKDYLPDVSVRLMVWAERQQGLIIARGNPRGIQSLQDLVRPELRFVNRQRGAGTRLLLDYNLTRLGLDSQLIHGYEHEEFTHLSAAAAIASGRADCGLGIAAAAFALDLDFIPLFNERYDLVIPSIHFDSPLLVPLLDLTQDGAFKQSLARLPGYDFSRLGEILI